MRHLFIKREKLHLRSLQALLEKAHSARWQLQKCENRDHPSSIRRWE